MTKKTRRQKNSGIKYEKAIFLSLWKSPTNNIHMQEHEAPEIERD
ncbi:MAG TPA: hypothetical protein VLD84_06030 [Nitrososphaeraceae archaeon]|nr:hypothetical protein [Nitrososphaeraceae archaeon]